MHRSTTAIITATEIEQTGYFYKMFRSIVRCLRPTGQDACHELLFRVSGDFYALGRQDTEITK